MKYSSFSVPTNYRKKLQIMGDRPVDDGRETQQLRVLIPKKLKEELEVLLKALKTVAERQNIPKRQQPNYTNTLELVLEAWLAGEIEPLPYILPPDPDQLKYWTASQRKPGHPPGMGTHKGMGAITAKIPVDLYDRLRQECLEQFESDRVFSELSTGLLLTYLAENNVFISNGVYEGTLYQAVSESVLKHQKADKQIDDLKKRVIEDRWANRPKLGSEIELDDDRLDVSRYVMSLSLK